MKFELDGKYVGKYPGWYNWPIGLALGPNNQVGYVVVVVALAALDVVCPFLFRFVVVEEYPYWYNWPIGLVLGPNIQVGYVVVVVAHAALVDVCPYLSRFVCSCCSC